MPHPDPVVCQEMVDLRRIVETTDAKVDKFLVLFEQHLVDDARIAPAIADLIHAWEQGVGMLKLIRWLAICSAFFGAIAVFVHDKIDWK